MTTRKWPCSLSHAQHLATAWCMPSSGRNECVVTRKPWSQAPGLGELLSRFPGCITPKSACRAVRSIENTPVHKTQQHRCIVEMY